MDVDMPDPKITLKIVCAEMFSDRDQSASKVKALALSTIPSGKAAGARAAEIRASLDWVYECLVSESGAGNGKRISQSEDLAMHELQRPSRSASDTHAQAKARYVLAVIAHLRGELEVCASNVAWMAAEAPGWFRAEFPTVFNQVFRPSCQAAYDQLDAEMEKASAKSYLGYVFAKRAAALAIGTGVGAAAVGVVLLTGAKGGGLSIATRQAISGAAAPIWTSATRKDARKADFARIQARFEKRLDEECRVVARNLL